jgi:hypothetical protein
VLVCQEHSSASFYEKAIHKNQNIEHINGALAFETPGVSASHRGKGEDTERTVNKMKQSFLIE